MYAIYKTTIKHNGDNRIKPVGSKEQLASAKGVVEFHLNLLKHMDSFIRTIYINDYTWIAVMQKETIVYAIEEI